MAKKLSFRVNDVEAEFIKTESIRMGIPQSEIIRRAVWNAASISSLTQRFDETLTQEIATARQLLDAEFELQKAETIAEIDRNHAAHFSKFIAWLGPKLTAKQEQDNG